jgi:hypothetical protein
MKTDRRRTVANTRELPVPVCPTVVLLFAIWPRICACT